MSSRATRTRRGSFKRESTHFGLPTPNESMTSSGSLHPKEEEIGKRHLSNRPEALSFRSNDGLPSIAIDVDEGYATQAAAEKKYRQDRSASPSIEPLAFYFRQPTIQPQPNAHRQSMASRLSMAPSIAQSMAPSMAPSIPQMIGASLQIVGEKVNLLVNAIEELRKLGLKEIDTELPELVLVGDQSAGKSTLMGAIAEINLPKNKGMCTRCPANIKTSPAESWSCTVSLHEYFYHSQDLRRVPTKNQPFPPWKEYDDQSPKMRRFKTIVNKSELEDVLKWAQIALLNPSQDYRSFVPGSGVIAQHGLKEGHKNEADFSPNIVAIEISGPRLPALSFYDLPGIFVYAANEDEQYLIKVFENLAVKYIKKQNALIICAMTMQNDPGLSRTSAIIKEHKAENRTIGVLTMPDRLQEGSTHMDYDKILKDQDYRLPRGYFVTKQPGPDFKLRKADYHAQAREEEDLYFSTDPRWTGEWQEYQSRCGTVAIQTYLSQEFARLIANSMPSIDEKIRAQAALVDSQLQYLPELPQQNVQHVVRQSLQNFSNSVKSFLQGGANSNDFLCDWGQLSADFGSAIQAMKPKFIIGDLSTSLPLARSNDVISIDSEDETMVNNSPRKHGNNFVTPQAKRQKLFTDSPSSWHRGSITPSANGFPLKKEEGSPSPSVSSSRPTPYLRPTVFSSYHDRGNRFMSISKVRETILKHKRPGHPDNVTDAAREEMCLKSLEKWNEPLYMLSDTTFATLKRATLKALDSTLASYRQTDLYRQSRSHITRFLQLHHAEQRVVLQSFYDLERYKLFTINEEAFAKYKAEELQLLQDKRRDLRTKAYVEKHSKDKKPLNDTARAAAIKAVTIEQLGPDPFAREIDTAAYVRGYYRTAGFRFADNVTQNLQGMLFRKVHDEIAHLLENYLGLNEGDGEAKCRALMVEDHGEARQRAQLQEEKVKLTQAAARLEQLVHELGVAPEPLADGGDGDEDEDEELILARRHHRHYSPPSTETEEGDA